MVDLTLAHFNRCKTFTLSSLWRTTRFPHWCKNSILFSRVSLYIPPVVFLSPQFHSICSIMSLNASRWYWNSDHSMNIATYVFGSHPRGWQAKVTFVKTAETSTTNSASTFVFVRWGCIDVTLKVTKSLSVRGHQWHYAFVCFRIVYCWTVFFLLMLGTLSITSVPLFMSFWAKMAPLVWFNAFQVFLTFSCKFFF